MYSLNIYTTYTNRKYGVFYLQVRLIGGRAGYAKRVESIYKCAVYITSGIDSSVQ